MRNALKVVMALAMTAAVAAVGIPPTTGSAQPATPLLLGGLQATLFASGNASYSHPDSIEVDSYLGIIYVGYQNVTAKDGSDGTTNAIWQITGTFSPGTVYTETPDDSSVVGLLATLSLSSGTLTPVGIGFKKPTGLAFIPSS
jgi:hypothetical protein